MNEEKGGGVPFLIKIFFIIILSVIVFVATATYRELQKKKQVQDEINKLQDEAERISRENLQIQEKINYFQTSDYKEKEAKDKLNLQSPDENVVVIKPSIIPEISKTELAAEPVKPATKENIPNPKKWWDYLFKY